MPDFKKIIPRIAASIKGFSRKKIAVGALALLGVIYAGSRIGAREKTPPFKAAIVSTDYGSVFGWLTPYGGKSFNFSDSIVSDVRIKNHDTIHFNARAFGLPADTTHALKAKELLDIAEEGNSIRGARIGPKRRVVFLQLTAEAGKAFDFKKDIVSDVRIKRRDTVHLNNRPFGAPADTAEMKQAEKLLNSIKYK